MSDNVEFAASPAVKSPSIGDRIKAELAARKVREIVLSHVDAPEWKITCRVPTDGFELDELQERATGKTKGSGTGSNTRFARALLATMCESIAFWDEPVTDDAGLALTFRDKAFQDIVSASSATEAVSKSFGSDTVIAALSNRLIAECGLDAQNDVEVDPTPAA